MPARSCPRGDKYAISWPGTLCLYVSREERGAALGVERSQQQAICLMARNSDRYWVRGDQTNWCGVT